jgi:hypothetical protein
MMSAHRQADRQVKDGLRARKKWGLRNSKKAYEEAHAYLDAHHEFALAANGTNTGEIRVMTGREGKVHNEILKQDFVDEIHRAYPAYVQVPMKRWILVEKFTKKPRTTGDPDAANAKIPT